MGDGDHNPITSEASRRGMRLAIMAQCFGVALIFALTRGGLGVLYAQRFGAGDLMVGAVNGSLGAGAVAALICPGLIGRYGKLRVLIGALLIGLLAALPLPLLPWLRPFLSDRAILTIMALSLLGQGCSYGGLLASWFVALRDFVPTRESGVFFGRLRTAWQITALAVALVCFFALRREGAPIWRFQLILTALTVGLVVRVFLVRGFPQRPARRSGPGGVMHGLGAMFRDVPFRRFTLFSVLLTICMRSLYPTVIVFVGKSGLRYSEGAVLLAAAVGMLAAVIGYVGFGRMADRHGSGRVYRACFVAAFFGLLLAFPASYMVRVAGRRGVGYALILGVFALLGAAEAGSNVGVSRHSFQLTPHRRAATHLAVQPCLMFLGSGVAMFLAGCGMEFFGASESTAWLSPYVAAFAINAACCAVLYRLVRHVPKSEEAS